MASGLVALLDDIAALAKLTAATVDDVAYGAMKASAKSAGVIIDDTAVTPQYVSGISAKRELGVIFKIAKGSFFNKFVLIIPIAMILTSFAPWLLPYLLICGGLYLSYEGGEKIYEWLSKTKHSVEKASGEDAENKIIKSATRTDLILSTEIMLIGLSNIDSDQWWMRLLILAAIGIIMTAIVYGAVAILIKIDDVGLWLTKKKNQFFSKFGYGLVNSMPKVFQVIGVIGTIAMLWVGGHILIVNLAEINVSFLHELSHYFTSLVESFGSVIVWFVDTLSSAIVGLVIGVVCFLAVHLIEKSFHKTKNKKEIKEAVENG